MRSRNTATWLLTGALALGPGCTPNGADVASEHASGDASSAVDVDCGIDVIAAWVAGDSEVVSLRDRSEAEFNSRWLDRVSCLAELGDAESQLKLGIAYRDGSDGPPQDYSAAAAWFRRAADQADPMAQFNLARLYHDGLGVQQDIVRAHMWANIAASGFDWTDDMRSAAFALRDSLESGMTTGQVQEAQRLAGEWYAGRDVNAGRE